MAEAVDFEFISLEQKSSFDKRFSQAKPIPDAVAAQSLKHTWLCDMFGMRSRMQVQRGIRLYSWPTVSADGLANKGAHLVGQYRFENGELQGHTHQFEDRVRLEPTGHIIAQLSATKPRGQVISYSVCKPL
ncbi:MAG: hypothetical protein AB7F86_09380 [Bdellovibrionales bacterium]